jgi:hypothetical protein
MPAARVRLRSGDEGMNGTHSERGDRVGNGRYHRTLDPCVPGLIELGTRLVSKMAAANSR